MANELENSIRNAAVLVAKYVGDAATMEVKTYYVLVSSAAIPDLEKERPGAYTEVRLDGDSKTVVPMRPTADGNGMELDSTLFEIHERNVNTATEYRARVLNSLISLLQRGR